MVVVLLVDLDMIVCVIVFLVVGTVGQWCTSFCCLIVYKFFIVELFLWFKKVYVSLLVGNPLREEILVGLFIDVDVVGCM